jgi:aryl-alcohol dehydrogenase-like predicted oxidoreductase
MTAIIDNTRPTLGLGCWAIGGPFFAGDRAVGWGDVDDAVSTRAIHTAVEHGIRLFDTAQAYGAGHSETVLGAALKSHPDVAIVTKVGVGIDTHTKQITFGATDPAAIKTSIDASRERLQRDCIDMILLHDNELPITDAAPIFDMLAGLCRDGVIKSYGWSTDFPDRATAFADQPGFVAVEHAMNLFLMADHMVPTVQDAGLVPLIRSPLAMGVLGGKYDAGTTFSSDDIRGSNDDWKGYFHDGRITPETLSQLQAVRDILTSGGRTLAQGALAWLWGRSAAVVPIPGFRTPDQVNDLCGALDHGPLTPTQMAEVETVLDRPDPGPPTSR